MSYREHPAPALLSPWLECLWERTADAAERVRVLPDGCIDVVWTRGSGPQLVGTQHDRVPLRGAAGHGG